MSIINETKEANKVDYQVEVINAKVISKSKINFSVKVNGVYIYNMHYIEYKNSKGEEKTMLSFPQWKSEQVKDENGNPKYMNYCAFPISKELQADIEKQIAVKVNKK